MLKVACFRLALARWRRWVTTNIKIIQICMVPGVWRELASDELENNSEALQIWGSRALREY